MSSLQHGETAIHLSCGLGQLDALKFLVKKGGGLETTDTQGDTPLHWAARQGHAHIIAYLIEQGAQINTQNKVRIGLLCVSKALMPLAGVAKAGVSSSLCFCSSHS